MTATARETDRFRQAETDARRLLAMERRLDVLSKALHRMTRMRDRLREDALRLRMGFTREASTLYEAMRER